jgi:uncharacterized membrane protein
MIATLVPRLRSQAALEKLAPPAPARPRLEALDVVRGLAMVLMALDHVRVYFLATRFDPTDLSRTTAGLFLTRWATHFCAPTFVFLCGTSAFLSGARRGRRALAGFLLARGLWLVLLELTLVHLGWFFTLSYRVIFLQVIWAIGWSMVALAPLVFLPPRVVAGIGIAVVALHNVINHLAAGLPAPLLWMWKALHEPGSLALLPGHRIISTYPVLPWFGVLAAGYGLGALLLEDCARPRLPEDRVRLRRRALALGAVLTLGFVALRVANVGDPHPWALTGGLVRTALSFFNCCKYPPSPAFVLMTLGPALLVLGLCARAPGPLGRLLARFGRVPLFFYLVHLPLLHAIAVAVSWLRHGWSPGLLEYPLFFPAGQLPAGYGFRLPVVYAIWAASLVPLYLACRWFARVKQGRRDWWLSYL